MKDLDFLVEELKKESAGYQNVETPNDEEGKRYFLRSLMNVRAPKQLKDEVLKVQDEYLQNRAIEKGIVKLEDIPTIKETLNSANTFADKLSVWQGDITRLGCDAIVNAANSQMLGCFVPNHQCIDNAIHTFAGIELRCECNRQMNLLREKNGNYYEQPTSIPMLTDAFNLPSKHVIHVVGPIVYGSLTTSLENDLINCYKNVLDMCKDNNIRSVAFCCISTGEFHFPNEKAAKIAVDTVTEWLDENYEYVDRIIFNVFKDLDKGIYEELLSR